jgi:hypothetical protein
LNQSSGSRWEVQAGSRSATATMSARAGDADARIGSKSLVEGLPD